jgi:PAS domain S-box-containing protein
MVSKPKSGKKAGVKNVAKCTRTEDALKQSEQRLKDILDSIQDGFFELDREYRCTYVNLKAAMQGGLEPEEYIGNCIWDIFPYARGTQFEAVYRGVMETRRPAHFEVKSPSMDMYYDISVYPSIIGISVFWRDITEPKRAEEALRKARDELEVRVKERTTELQRSNDGLRAEIQERKKAEEALLESEEKYRCIVETANEGIWMIDADARTTFVNRVMADMLGYAPEEMIGKLSYDFMDEETRAASRARFEERRQGARGSPEVKYIRKDGTPVWTISSSTPLLGGDGRMTSILGMVTDITERKLAEDALRESESRLSLVQNKIIEQLNADLDRRTTELRTLLDLLPISACITEDRDSKTMYANPIMEDLLGVQRESNMSMSAPEDEIPNFKVLRNGVDLPADELPIQRAIATGMIVKDAEYDIVRSDGRIVSFHGHAAPLFDEEGNVRGAIGVFEDVTESKRAEEELCRSRDELEQRVRERTVDLQRSNDTLLTKIEDIKRAEEKILRLNNDLKKRVDELQTLFGMLPISVSISEDPECKTMTANKVFEELVRVPTGSNISQSAPADEKTSFKAFLNGREIPTEELPMQKAAATGKPVIGSSFDAVCMDGRIVNFYGHAVPLFDEEGKVRGAVGVFDDVTERKRMEEILRQSNETLEAFFATSPGILNIEDDEFRYIKTDALTPTYFGLDRQTIIGRSVRELAPEFAGDYEAMMRRVIDTGEPVLNVVVKSPVLARPGEITYWQASYFRVPINNGKYGIGIMGVEITDIKKAEKALGEAKLQSELYLDLMGHDISNMHQIIMGQLELANEIIDVEGGLDEKGKGLIETSLNTLNRSARLIENVRNLQKLRHGEFKDESIDINNLLSSVVKEYEFMLPPSSIKFVGNGPCRVIANKLLHDVFTNLVGNAIKHSNGDNIDININLESASENGKNYYKVSVADNGPGIPDDMKDKIFNRLQRGETKARGLGLGLYLVKSLMDSYHGRVWVEDRVEGDYTNGSRFVVLLPAMGDLNGS